MENLFNKEKQQVKGVWTMHQIRQYNGPRQQLLVEASKQVTSLECGHDDFVAPRMIYLQDKGRLLMVTYYNDWTNFRYLQAGMRNIALVLYSDDMGETWYHGEPLVDIGGTPVLYFDTADMVYLGNGKVMLIGGKVKGDAYTYHSGILYRYISEDWGETWRFDGEIKEEEDKPLRGRWMTFRWQRFYVDPLYSTEKDQLLIWSSAQRYSTGLRFSKDGGKNWTNRHNIYAFSSLGVTVDEMSIIRAQNGDLIASMGFFPNRSDYAAWGHDHVCGLCTSYSTDNGWTWSKPQILFEFGRHHADMVSMPDGDIVMTYFVAQGYPRDEFGHIQAGMEAVVSHDFGRTWDLDHRYILDDWAGNCPEPRPSEFLNAGLYTSTVLLPDNSLMTVCSSGVNSPVGEYNEAPECRCPGHELHLVRWRLNEEPLNNCRDFSDADPRSDLRNKVCNYATENGNLAGWMKHHRNIALPELGVTVSGSESDRKPDRILEDRYSRRTVFFVTCPAWFEISFPEEKCIDGIIIHPGADPMGVEWFGGLDYLPSDYTIQYEMKDGLWKDVIPPVKGKKPFHGGANRFDIGPEEYTHEYSFEPIITNKLRFEITKSTDCGRCRHLTREFILPESKRRTAIRKVEVLEKR